MGQRLISLLDFSSRKYLAGKGKQIIVRLGLMMLI